MSICYVLKTADPIPIPAGRDRRSRVGGKSPLAPRLVGVLSRRDGMGE